MFAVFFHNIKTADFKEVNYIPCRFKIEFIRKAASFFCFFIFYLFSAQVYNQEVLVAEDSVIYSNQNIVSENTGTFPLFVSENTDVYGRDHIFISNTDKEQTRRAAAGTKSRKDEGIVRTPKNTKIKKEVSIPDKINFIEQNYSRATLNSFLSLTSATFNTQNPSKKSADILYVFKDILIPFWDNIKFEKILLCQPLSVHRGGYSVRPPPLFFFT